MTESEKKLLEEAADKIRELEARVKGLEEERDNLFKQLSDIDQSRYWGK